jgi:crossover junction endodeoxyribonuclease RuvC
MKVLAIDPGYDRLGIAVVEGNASAPILVWSDCIVPEKGSRELRLAHILEAVTSAISIHAPDILALEKLFFSTNKKTALGVAEARGVVLAAAGTAKIPVIECSPQEVKMSVTGYGSATKAAIARMIPRLISLSLEKRLDDELDAIAVGITALALKGSVA